MSSLVDRSRRFRLVAPVILLSMSTGGAEDPLRFPKDAFTVETRTVRTSRGERVVTYRSYEDAEDFIAWIGTVAGFADRRQP